MDCATGDKFQEVAAAAIRAAEGVPCSLEEFAEGLKIMEGVLEIHRESFQGAETEDES